MAGPDRRAGRDTSRSGLDTDVPSDVPSAKVRPPLLSGVRRDRLTRLLVDGPAGTRIVHGIAGSGKTTVLGHAAHGWSGPVVWVSADGTDRSGNRFARALAQASGCDSRVVPEGAPVADAAFAAIAALEAQTEPTLVVIDDAHELAGSPPAEAIELLDRYRPAHVTLVLSTRHLGGTERWAWQGGAGRVLDGDQLRFRLWEVDALFRDHYGERLTSDELRSATRLTDGWAVALHLLYVATRTLPAVERRRLTAGPRLTVRSIREYLAEQVLSTVDAEQRTLLRRIAVLDRIRAERCERLLAVDGCADRLGALAHVGLLAPEADGITYRLHELLRAHLLGELDDEIGPGGAAALHRRAANVLEAEGDLVEAVRAYGRGGDWDGVHRLLARDDNPVAFSAPWADGVPSRLRDTDPWVLRAIGRRQLGEGHLDAARGTLDASLARFREHGGDARTRRTLRLVEGWLAPDPGQRRTWTECLRAAFAGEAVGSWPDEPGGWLGEGIAALFAGRLRPAAERLHAAAMTLDGEVGVLAEIALSLVSAFRDPEPGPAAERALARARSIDAPALTTAAEMLAAYAAGDLAGAGEGGCILDCPPSPAGAAVGETVAGFVTGLAMLEAGSTDAARTLDLVAGVWQGGGLRVPAALARAAAMVAATRSGAAAVDIDAEIPVARAAGPMAHALVLLAQEIASGDRSSGCQSRALGREHGFGALLDRLAPEATAEGDAVELETRVVVLPDSTWRTGRGAGPVLPVEAPIGEAPPVEVRALGECRVLVGGVDCDVQQLRPRHEELLSILVAHPNVWLHRERLFACLWPDASPDKATRNLQVAVSAVRRLVEPDAAPGQPQIVVRSGERYRLAVAEERSDMGRLEMGLRAARAAVRSGDAPPAAGRLREALAEWRGEPVPSVGPVDWAVERRRQLVSLVSQVTVEVVELLRLRGDAGEAAALAARGVEIDPMEDRLWRLAVAAAADAGSAVQAADLEQRYRSLIES